MSWDCEELLFGIELSEPAGPASRELAALNARVKCASSLRDSSSRGEPGRDRLQLGAPDMR